MQAGARIQLGCGGDYVSCFGSDLVFGGSVAEVKSKIQARWNKSIGRSYQVSYIDGRGDEVIETFIPKLVKDRKPARRNSNATGQLEFCF